LLLDDHWERERKRAFEAIMRSALKPSAFGGKAV
jgi:hypothetical protein